MAIKLGSTNFSSLYLGSVKIGEAYLGSVKVFGSSGPNYNPLNLPPFTMRLQFTEGVTPTFITYVDGITYTQVSSSPNVWDVRYYDTTWFCPIYSTSRNDLIALLGANPTSYVRETRYMFANCESLTSVALFDTSSITDMDGMFANCSSLTTIPAFPTGNATDMSCMFNDCTSLNSVPLLDTSHVTTFISMFGGCSSLTTVPQFNTSSATDMSSMFMNCTHLESVPLFDTSSVTDMACMFNYCVRLKSIPLFDTSACRDMYTMFDSCWKVESGALALYNQASAQSPAVTRHTYCFRNCGADTTTGAAELAQIGTGWK